MTDADRKKWERVATRIGEWKPCDMMPVANGVGNYCVSHQQYTMRAHDCLMWQLPDPSDPAMIVAMLEWLIQFLKDHPEDRSWADVGAYTVYEDRPLHVALINVITVLPQEARNG